MANALISIVMNCYNGEKYLREAIDSVRTQTYPHWELVFWDNRSTDSSAAIAQSYGDDRIRYILAPQHTTLGGARRLAVNECRGDFISFLDTDDIYLPENLSRKLEFIERENAAVVYGGVIYINEDGVERRRRLPIHRSGMIIDAMLRQFETDVPTMMIRRSVLQETKLNFDERIFGSEEYDLLLLLSATHRFAVVREYLSKLRHHRSSLTYSVMEKWSADRLLTLAKLKERHPGIDQRFSAAFREAYARAHYYRARWLVQENRRAEALDVLRPLDAAGWRYRSLYLALRISPAFWNFAHGFLPSSRQL
jgi:glycosyltransferase involved in cell wall biosynthesis